VQFQQLAKLDLSAAAASFPHIVFSVTVGDLGVTLDQELTFATHISHLCRDCYYQQRQLRTISHSLLLLLLHLHVSMPLSQFDLTIALHSTLVSLPYA